MLANNSHQMQLNNAGLPSQNVCSDRIKEVMALTGCSESTAVSALNDCRYVVTKAVVSIKSGNVNDQWEESGKKKKSTSETKTETTSKKQSESKVVHYTAQPVRQPERPRQTKTRRVQNNDNDEMLSGLVFTPSNHKEDKYVVPEAYRVKKSQPFDDAEFDMLDISDMSSIDLEIQTSIRPAQNIKVTSAAKESKDCVKFLNKTDGKTNFPLTFNSAARNGQSINDPSLQKASFPVNTESTANNVIIHGNAMNAKNGSYFAVQWSSECCTEVTFGDKCKLTQNISCGNYTS